MSDGTSGRIRLRKLGPGRLVSHQVTQLRDRRASTMIPVSHEVPAVARAPNSLSYGVLGGCRDLLTPPLASISSSEPGLMSLDHWRYSSAN